MIIAPYRGDLKQILILNPKGGCGKTTLATNLASCFALRGSRPLLIDNDPKGYTSRWLEKRPQSSCRIDGIASRDFALHERQDLRMRIPNETDTVIIDTPAALGRQEVAELTYSADCILVPILPSAFDISYATNFIAELLLLTQFERPIAVVANRTQQNTRSLAMLMRILENFETPTIAVLRNSQNYVYAADLGLGIYELPRYRVKKDLEQMDRVVDWLDRLLTRTWEPGMDSPVYHHPKPFPSPGLAFPD